ncbi:hypothetical protein [Xanthomonas axonopodis]
MSDPATVQASKSPPVMRKAHLAGGFVLRRSASGNGLPAVEVAHAKA